MRPHGRARVNPLAPQAFAVCDRCGKWINHVNLRTQVEWAGVRTVDTGFRVCDGCLDVPQEQLRSLILPPDPVPIRNPRVELALLSPDDVRATEAGDVRETEDDLIRILEGEPDGA